MNNKVFCRAGSEEQIEIVSSQSEGLATGFGQKDVVACWNGSSYSIN